MGKTLTVVNHVLKNGCEYQTSPFGPRSDPFNGNASFHNGLDMVSSKYGTDYIIAYQDGTVEALRNTISGVDRVNTSGNYIYIKHDGGYQTRYLHLKKDTLTVKVGQTVRKGDVIAYMGTTGNSTGSHLHLEVRLNGDPQDPEPYLRGDKTIPTQPDQEPVPPAAALTVGSIVNFKGGHHYSNAQADTPTGGRRSAGKAKITVAALGKRHPYHLIGVDGGSDVYGWVDADTIGSAAAQSPVTYKEGDVVVVNAGAKWYTGKSIPAWVREDKWIVCQDQTGDRVVLNFNISKTNSIMSPIRASDITKV